MDSAPINHFLFKLGEGTLSYRTAKRILQSDALEGKELAKELGISNVAFRQRLMLICQKMDIRCSVHNLRLNYLKFLEEEINLYLEG